MTDLFRGVRDKIDFRVNAKTEYQARVASKNLILDVGGQNRFSRSGRRVSALSQKPNTSIVSTDIIASYGPDIVDDICNTAISANSCDGVYCEAVLEHVQEYWKAIDNIYSILKTDGEAFFYVPFMFHYHDSIDHHRFTFTEVVRMLEKFSEVRIFAPGNGDGFGWVSWYVITMTTITRFRRLHNFLSKLTDALLGLILSVLYRVKESDIQERYDGISLDDFRYYYTYLFMNHGFCAWARK
ncbi:MAG: methyltransferase domain-containing protein [Thermodesulfobacteriota bacterium]|nr:methyltransferase domain-containing protein [Thermodesulfobacteriota bacterium]